MDEKPQQHLGVKFSLKHVKSEKGEKQDESQSQNTRRPTDNHFCISARKYVFHMYTNCYEIIRKDLVLRQCVDILSDVIRPDDQGKRSFPECEFEEADRKKPTCEP